MPGGGVAGIDAANERPGRATWKRHPHDVEFAGSLARAPNAEDQAAATGQDVRPLGPDLVTLGGELVDRLERPPGRADTGQAGIDLDIDVAVRSPVSSRRVDAVGQRERRAALEG